MGPLVLSVNSNEILDAPMIPKKRKVKKNVKLHHNAYVDNC